MSQGIPCTKSEHFDIIRFWVIVRTDKHKDRHTQKDAVKRFTPATVFGVSKNNPTEVAIISLVPILLKAIKSSL